MIITPKRLPIPVEWLMYSEHGRISVALALVHSDNSNIATSINLPATLTSKTENNNPSLVPPSLLTLRLCCFLQRNFGKLKILIFLAFFAGL